MKMHYRAVPNNDTHLPHNRPTSIERDRKKRSASQERVSRRERSPGPAAHLVPRARHIAAETSLTEKIHVLVTAVSRDILSNESNTDGRRLLRPKVPENRVCTSATEAKPKSQLRGEPTCTGAETPCHRTLRRVTMTCPSTVGRTISQRDSGGSSLRAQSHRLETGPATKRKAHAPGNGSQSYNEH